MKAHRSLQNVVLPTRGSLLRSLALITLSAAAAASPGHGIGSHLRVSVHHAAGRSVVRAHDVAVRTQAAPGGPWMYATFKEGPWMY
jgi:hypothetical protein